MHATGHGSSKSRANLRSPLTHSGNDEVKSYKKKYEEMRDSFRHEKKTREQLEGFNRELERRVNDYEDIMSKQEREMQKK